MRNMQRPHLRPPLFMLLFMSIFGFIGVTVLIFLWTASGFGAPPLIFRVFGSFIALAFILMGFGMPISILIKSRNHSEPTRSLSLDRRNQKTPLKYDCPHCGGNVGEREVSPSGDIKCQYCNEWWNVHGQSSR